MLTDQQLVERLKYVTGSDAASICGLSPWKSAYQLWQEKTGKVEAEDISDKNHIKFGNYMEDGVAQWFAAETGKELKVHDEMIVHKSLPWMAGNIDRLIVGENAILECKTAYTDSDWGIAGTDQIPEHYLMQVAHYCAVGGFDKCYIAVVFVQKREMCIYEYNRHLGLEEKLIAKEQKFWIEHVLENVAPEPGCVKDIEDLYKELNKKPLIAETDTITELKMIAKLKAEIKAKKAQLEAFESTVKLTLGEFDTFVDAEGKALATWKWIKPTAGFNKKQLEVDMPEVFQKYVTKGTETRRFNIKIKGE